MLLKNQKEGIDLSAKRVLVMLVTIRELRNDQKLSIRAKSLNLQMRGTGLIMRQMLIGTSMAMKITTTKGNPLKDRIKLRRVELGNLEMLNSNSLKK